MRTQLLLLTIGCVAVVGCRGGQQVRDPEFAAVEASLYQARYLKPESYEELAPAPADLAGPHPVDEYVQFALRQNPEVQAARKRVEVFAYQVPVAASLQDPMLSVTAQPEPVQTAAGQQDLIVSASQKLHWFGKLDTRAGVAEAQTNVARAHLAAVELATIARVKRAYYELYFIQKAIAITETEQKLLGDIRNVANTRYKAGRTSQQDVLRAEVEIANVENDLLRLRQQLTSARARLGSILHVSPQTKLQATNELHPEVVPKHLESLQHQAVKARPELHAQLAAVARDRRVADLARLDYRPDVTVGLSWIDVAQNGISPVANGRDSFLVNAGVNLPIYRKRLEAAVRSAEANAVSTAREYDAMRDATLEEVADLFAQVQSQQDMLKLFQGEILPKARQTLEVSSQAYNVGDVDFLQLIDNWRQLLRYEVMYRRLESTLRQTLAELDRVVGGLSTPSTTDTEPPPRPPK